MLLQLRRVEGIPVQFYLMILPSAGEITALASWVLARGSESLPTFRLTWLDSEPPIAKVGYSLIGDLQRAAFVASVLLSASSLRRCRPLRADAAIRPPGTACRNRTTSRGLGRIARHVQRR